MRNTLNRTFTSLYAVAMTVFLGLAFTLVLAQIAGLVFAQGSLIASASDTLLRPAIVTAVVAGVLGFCVFNLQGTPVIDDEAD
ncbi:MAG: hypothetical protein QME72_09355 [Rhodococcus sp. (in: high G+C Gram-positive bacteria)]|nr:hypothetical protein [Rhodococcus sp. (in: high G+C Gram-positive bacteria)]MDI6627912.1 hypothetical protein [Rhodococcus sp. (in: high G+C Gram-positive bacteria)]